MKKQLSILCVSAGIVLAGCSSASNGNHSLGSCSGESRCTAEKPIVAEVTLDSTSYFKTDSYALSAMDQTTLRQVVAYLKDHPNENIRINGYADSTGAADYNVRLSQKRAEAVSDYLKAHGISSSRITTHGYGATNFVAANDTAMGRAKNRRAEILFYE